MCHKCGKPVDEEQEFCRNCEQKSYTFLEGRSALVYNTWMQKSMSAFKYRKRKENGEFYADRIHEIWGERIKAWEADVFVPVPIHPHRYQKRGYNQAEVIASYLSERTGIPVEMMLERTKDTRPQKDLSQAERMRNLQGAFSLSLSATELNPKPKCAIIVDDIYTTGSTIEACAQTLQIYGITKIYFICVCTGIIR